MHIIRRWISPFLLLTHNSLTGDRRSAQKDIIIITAVPPNSCSSLQFCLHKGYSLRIFYVIPCKIMFEGTDPIKESYSLSRPSKSTTTLPLLMISSCLEVAGGPLWSSPNSRSRISSCMDSPLRIAMFSFLLMQKKKKKKI